MISVFNSTRCKRAAEPSDSLHRRVHSVQLHGVEGDAAEAGRRWPAQDAEDRTLGAAAALHGPQRRL